MEWISVEKLPKYDCKCIVTIDDGDKKHTDVLDYRTALYKKDKLLGVIKIRNSGFYVTDSWGTYRCDWNVTHWMPLPPPKSDPTS